MSTLVDLCSWAMAFDPSDAPPAVHQRLRLQVLSTMAATTAGVGAEDVGPVLQLSRTRPGPLTVAPGASGMDIEGSLAAAAALCSADSYDDWLLTARPGPSVWTAWLTAAELDRSWADALRVQLAVNEILTRLGGLTLPGVREGRSRVWLHAAGSALASSMLLDLSAEQAAHAVATAMASASRPHRSVELGGPHLAAVGDAVLSGRRCALLAARGLKGPIDCLDEGADLAGRLAGRRPLRGWLTGLGSAWLTSGLSFAIIPGGPLTACAVEAALEILEASARETGTPLRAADVLRVDVEATILTCARARHFTSGDDESAPALLSPGFSQRSIRSALRLALTHGRLTPRELRLDALAAAVRDSPDLIGRIHVHHEWQLSLRTWEAIRTGLGGDRLLDGLGPKGIARLIAGRTGGMAWMELPFALAADRLSGASRSQELRDFPAELVDDPAAMLAKGVQVAADWAAKRMEQLLLGPAPPDRESITSAERGPGARPEAFDLADVGWADFALPLPARVRILVHGGRVREAERTHPLGSPGRPIEETVRRVRDKWLSVRPQGDADQRWTELAGLILSADGSIPSLPPGGPRAFLTRLERG
jgi:2-methylcitrate dehydratase PrpD